MHLDESNQLNTQINAINYCVNTKLLRKKFDFSLYSVSNNKEIENRISTNKIKHDANYNLTYCVHSDDINKIDQICLLLRSYKI